MKLFDGFTETDERILQKLFESKKEQGFDPIIILIKLDELKISKSSIKTFYEDIIYTLKEHRKEEKNAISTFLISMMLLNLGRKMRINNY